MLIVLHLRRSTPMAHSWMPRFRVSHRPWLVLKSESTLVRWPLKPELGKGSLPFLRRKRTDRLKPTRLNTRRESQTTISCIDITSTHHRLTGSKGINVRSLSTSTASPFRNLDLSLSTSWTTIGSLVDICLARYKARVGNHGPKVTEISSTPLLYMHHSPSPRQLLFSFDLNLNLNLTGVLRSLGCTYLSHKSRLETRTLVWLARKGEIDWKTQRRDDRMHQAKVGNRRTRDLSP